MNANRQADRRNRAAQGLAIGLWLVLGAVVVVKTAWYPKVHSTYPLFHDVAAAWWSGDDIYENASVGDYRYGPSFAVVLGPIAWLPYTVGAVVWALLNIGIAFWVTRTLARRVLPGMTSPLARNLLLAVAVFPSAHCLYSSQTNLLIFSLVAFASIAILDQRWWLAALLLAIAIHIKIWPLAGALLLVACWPRRLAWRLPVALAAVAALPLLAARPAVVWQQYLQWYQHVVGPAMIRHTYRDAWTIWELISKPVNPTVYTVLQLAMAAVALGLCLWRAFRLPPQRLVLFVLASWTTWQLVFGPGTERNTFSLIAPLTSWAVVVAVLQEKNPWLMGTGFLCTVLAAMVGHAEDMLPWLQALHPVGILLFFAWYLRWNWREADWECGDSPPLSISLAPALRNRHEATPSRLPTPHSQSTPSCFPIDN
jgi:hypothetical protein